MLKKIHRSRSEDRSHERKHRRAPPRRREARREDQVLRKRHHNKLLLSRHLHAVGGALALLRLRQTMRHRLPRSHILTSRVQPNVSGAPRSRPNGLLSQQPPSPPPTRYSHSPTAQSFNASPSHPSDANTHSQLCVSSRTASTDG